LQNQSTYNDVRYYQLPNKKAFPALINQGFKMNDSQYNLLADEMLIAIEDSIEECPVDIDYETTSGLLELTFPNGTKIIINKQAPLHEIWVATKFNGHHFEFKNEQWHDKRSGDEFWAFLSQAVSTQAEAEITLSQP
jgi:CyaY protein